MANTNTNTNTNTILIGLSGPSSSGKTTLARLLRSIFTIPHATPSINLIILHEDDFYKTDVDIPTNTFSSAQFGTRELQDWDCIGSIDVPLLRRTLQYIKLHGRLPEDMFSKEDQNAVGQSGVPDEVVRQVQGDVRAWFAKNSNSRSVNLVLIDGFLLYPDPASPESSPEHDLLTTLAPLLDLKLFLPSTRARTIERRAKRAGYVTLEGFWADPPGYVEDCVWPNYARDHAWLFGAVGGVDAGEVDREVAARAGVLVGPGCGETGMGEILGWGVERVREVVEQCWG